MQTYIGTKMINARPMTRDTYSLYRGWTLPEDEDGDEPGYLVEYLDGSASNHPAHKNYISWSPKDVFEEAYVTLGKNVSGEPGYLQRLAGELAEAKHRENKLYKFFWSQTYPELSPEEQQLLRAQHLCMQSYISILKNRRRLQK
jgi:hypothetical protein